MTWWKKALVVASGLAYMAAEVYKPKIGGAIVAGAFLVGCLGSSKWQVMPACLVAVQYGLLVAGRKESFLPFALLLICMLLWPSSKPGPGPRVGVPVAVATPTAPRRTPAMELARAPVVLDAVAEQQAAIQARIAARVRALESRG